MQTIKSRGLSAGSLFKLLFFGLLIPLFLFCTACGIASYFGYSTITLNNQFVYGGEGLLAGIIMGLVFPLIMSFILWILISIGLWIWTRFRTIDLTIKE